MKKGNGFTLIELIVILAIIALITALIIINFQSHRKEILLKQTAQELGLNIRMAQNMAISTLLNEKKSLNGYGIKISKGSSSYIIFADCDDNSQYSPPPATPCSELVENDTSELVEEMFLKKEVEVLSINPTPPLGSSVTIFFTSPYTTATISGGISDSAIITFSLKDDSSKTHQVSVFLANGVVNVKIE